MKFKHNILIISFIEGATVMAIEIGSSKLLSPVFGSSLYVWSSVLAITLLGLACGYFIGGKLSEKEHLKKTLFYILLLTVVFIFLMPYCAKYLSLLATGLPLLPAVIASSGLLILPSIVLLSTTSPILIALLTTDVKSSGANSGKIYAVSTLGGIVATFICGFYFIPTYGVTNTLFFFSIILSWSLLLLLEKKKNKLFYLISISLFSLLIFFYKKSPTHSFVKYSSDGMLGKIEVIDKRIDSINTIRLLLVNHIVQSEQNLKTKRSTSEYIHIIEKNIDSLPNKKALVLGLGAGLSANMLTKKNYKTTAIEIDDRIIQASKNYFDLDSTVKTICSDARVYINQCYEKFDLIMFDIYKAEEQPSHVISKESLQKLKLMLHKNALIVINTHGYLNGTIGLGTQCLLATLKQAGFNLKICTASTEPNYRNLIIFGSENPITHKLFDEINFSITDTLLINTDDKPVLEKLNAEASKTWRLNYIKNSTYIH